MYCELYSTTNGENFRKFFTSLKARLRNQYSRRKIYMCLDNHPGHWAKASVSLMKDLGIVPLWLPSYSCQFNSVGKRLATLSHASV